MAFGLPAQYNEIFPIGPIERQTAIETAKAALEEMGLAYEFFGDGMRARIKGSFNSWGEVLSIVVDEYGCLHVNSRCRGLQGFDWGKNKLNVREFLAIFRRKLLLNPSHPAGFTVEPYDPEGKTPLQRALNEKEN